MPDHLGVDRRGPDAGLFVFDRGQEERVVRVQQWAET